MFADAVKAPWPTDWAEPFRGPFRTNIRSLLHQHGTPVELGLSGLRSWKVHLDRAGPTAVLHVFEELLKEQTDPCCDPCRIIGWQHHPPSADSFTSPNLLLESHSHLLHGVIHMNGFGHLLRINGLEGGSPQLTGSQLMQMWDMICSWLRARCISVEDVSNKAGIDLRVLHPIAHGQTWYARRYTAETAKQAQGSSQRVTTLSALLRLMLGAVKSREAASQYVVQAARSQRNAETGQKGTGQLPAKAGKPPLMKRKAPEGGLPAHPSKRTRATAPGKPSAPAAVRPPPAARATPVRPARQSGLRTQDAAVGSVKAKDGSLDNIPAKMRFPVLPRDALEPAHQRTAPVQLSLALESIAVPAKDSQLALNALLQALQVHEGKWVRLALLKHQLSSRIAPALLLDTVLQLAVNSLAGSAAILSGVHDSLKIRYYLLDPKPAGTHNFAEITTAGARQSPDVKQRQQLSSQKAAIQDHQWRRQHLDPMGKAFEAANAVYRSTCYRCDTSASQGTQEETEPSGSGASAIALCTAPAATSATASPEAWLWLPVPLPEEHVPLGFMQAVQTLLDTRHFVKDHASTPHDPGVSHVHATVENPRRGSNANTNDAATVPAGLPATQAGEQGMPAPATGNSAAGASGQGVRPRAQDVRPPSELVLLSPRATTRQVLVATSAAFQEMYPIFAQFQASKVEGLAPQDNRGRLPTGIQKRQLSGSGEVLTLGVLK
ncbi:hypothetical protein WJX73_009158 [Symbiochloris irregularis]|uniref:PHD finger protein MALE STERILITY 1-like ubiquitin-like domain-containing protein n=1 Tax=Symbiochloris irregularis TaxID=706552 RepID=A0AAW1NUL9_9CHLO